MNLQEKLWDGSRKLSRTGDPLSSKLGAVDILPHIGKLQRRALALIEENPGRTANELSQIAQDRDTRTIGRRLNELEKKGYIKRGDIEKCTITKRHCHTWWAIEEKK